MSAYLMKGSIPLGRRIMGMEDWNPWHEAVKAGYSSAAVILVLAVGWLFGQRLTYVWNIRQKRRELQLTASQQFYAAYGEFFAVWKIWNRLDHQAPSFDDRRWELLIRAAGAEAIIEGMLVKLSAEVTLESSQIETLARFRQAFQQLRESVRDSHPSLGPAQNIRDTRFSRNPQFALPLCWPRIGRQVRLRANVPRAN